MEAALGAVLAILVTLMVAIAITAVFIFVTVLKRQRKFRKEWNNRAGGRW